MTVGEEEKELLARLDERTEAIQTWMSAIDKKIDALASSHVRRELFDAEISGLRTVANRQDSEIKTLKNQIAGAAISIFLLLVGFIFQLVKP